MTNCYLPLAADMVGASCWRMVLDYEPSRIGRATIETFEKEFATKA